MSSLVLSFLLPSRLFRSVPMSSRLLLLGLQMTSTAELLMVIFSFVVLFNLAVFVSREK